MPRTKKQHLKQRKDGRFCCLYHGIQFMGNTEDEALQKREEYKRQEAAGLLQQEDPTVSNYAARWLPLHKHDVSTKCYNDYAKQLEALCSVIGEKKMSAVTVDDAALVWKHYSGYSASTIKRSRMLFIALFDTAIENDICRKNPFRAKYAQPPKAPSGSHRNLTDKEIALICNTPHRMQLAAIIMLFAGLRRGEVLALSTDDIDIIKRTITINKAVRYEDNKAIISTPKTAAGIRTVPAISILRKYLSVKRGTGLILSTATSGYMTVTAFKRCWESYLSELSRAANGGIQKRWWGKTKEHKAMLAEGKHIPPYTDINIRPHDLRHTYCTMLRDSGVDMHQAMIWMGHADEKMILHIYDHVSEKRTQNSINQVEKTLQNMQNHMQASDCST